ncbi:hypothetical protein BC940DRAFT_334359 [Gongronella butleri]|nr:hypothetical protein BC940DRAFT_334359 [Gongronella butleri]
MNYFPSPPSSPTPSAADEDKVICGACDKRLGNDWFCSDCHQKCEFCNRFLTGEPCSRCWTYDAYRETYVRKPAASAVPRHHHHAVHSTAPDTARAFYAPNHYYVAPPSPPLTTMTHPYYDASFFYYSQLHH